MRAGLILPDRLRKQHLPDREPRLIGLSASLAPIREWELPTKEHSPRYGLGWKFWVIGPMIAIPVVALVLAGRLVLARIGG